MTEETDEGAIVLGLPHARSLASKLEVNKKTGFVRFKGPKTGLENGAYPDYDRTADKTAKAICRVLKRKLPRSDVQRRVPTAKETQREESPARTKTQTRETEENSELSTSSDTDTESDSEQEPIESETESEDHIEKPSKRARKHKSRNRRAISKQSKNMDEIIRKHANKNGFKILADYVSDDTSSDSSARNNDGIKRRGISNSINRRKKQKRRTGGSKGVPAKLIKQTNFKYGPRPKSKNSRNRGGPKLAKSTSKGTRKPARVAPRIVTSDDESSEQSVFDSESDLDELPHTKYRRRKYGKSSNGGRVTTIRPAEPAKSGAEADNKLDEQLDEDTLNNFWK
jgi:hypothetical protein